MTTQSQMLRVRATVDETGQIILAAPGLAVGDEVDVVLFLPPAEEVGGSPLGALRRRRARRRAVSASDVELFLEAERAAWEH